MCIDHGGFEFVVPEQFLNGADIGSVFEQVGGKTMTECMGFDVLACDTCRSCGLFHMSLHG